MTYNYIFQSFTKSGLEDVFVRLFIYLSLNDAQMERLSFSGPKISVTG